MYNHIASIDGLGTGLYQMTGSGDYDLDVHIIGRNGDQYARHAAEWAILGDGLTVAPGGRPSGTVRYTTAPYHMDVVFNGTSTAT